MIKKISLSNVACYKSNVCLETDKRINLIYGLNGAGKTVLSSFLYKPSLPEYSNCSFEDSTQSKILVYNSAFIQDVFYEKDSLKGVFTLSKENREAEQNIQNAQSLISQYQSQLTKAKEKLAENNSKRNSNQANAENTVWAIKSKYTGGDRVLEYCLDGLKGRKEVLLNHINSIKKIVDRPARTIDQLRKEVELLQKLEGNQTDLLQEIDIDCTLVENNELFIQPIIGNENSSVSKLISKLRNSDWVNEGLTYIGDLNNNEVIECPFCQNKTITTSLINDIKSYFDEVYEESIRSLKKLKDEYSISFGSIPTIERYLANIISEEFKSDIENAYNKMLSIFIENRRLIDQKIENPSTIVNLVQTKDTIIALNEILKGVNAKISEQNDKIKKREQSLLQIKNEFWKNMRWEYDQTLAIYNDELSKISESDAAQQGLIIKQEKLIAEQQEVIVENQKKTVNVDEAISNINLGLINLGIDSFSIIKFQDSFYRISRNGKCDKTFSTLSEGEKMIISFLYFIELCKGKEDSKEVEQRKIIIIDDPISSLSHIYIFNVGRLIKKAFFENKLFEQVFVLTHSLYFFYEITETNHDRREKDQKLFRIVKSPSGSNIVKMKYEEIQNDYQAYWYIIRDLDQPSALIANSMRNIIEYFFNFIEKTDLNNIFQKEELQENRFQAFYRFINRESHSLGQNIFDYKEFNYNDFRDAFEKVFVLNGYKEHYDKMMKK